jgi:Putative Flp pilus-assembly TadE/G-like/von Willebrand factor type A domain
MLRRGLVLDSGHKECRTPSERGQVLILWILALMVILVIGVIVVDVGLWLTERRKAQMAADFAALAAASELKVSAAAAEAKGLDFAARNGFANTPNEVEVDVVTPYNSDPGSVEVTIKQGSPMLFTSIFGVEAFDIGARAVGTLGSGEAGPLDLVIIIDRTTTMFDTPSGSSIRPIDNAKEAATQALTIFDPSLQHVALGVIWADDPANPCNYHDTGDWVPVKLSQGNDYRHPDGSLNSGSTLVQRINCLRVSSGPGTNLGDPVTAAADELLNNSIQSGTPRKAMILLTDGQANEPGGDPCDYANQRADAAKSAGIELFTIGFGVTSLSCNNGTPVIDLLADMATNSNNQFNCATQSGQNSENSDRDHFFCEAKGDDLTPIFQRIAEDLTQGYRLEE